eukprot:228077-Chlamydomonas_euryale.AAC.5
MRVQALLPVPQPLHVWQQRSPPLRLPVQPHPAALGDIALRCDPAALLAQATSPPACWWAHTRWGCSAAPRWTASARSSRCALPSSGSRRARSWTWVRWRACNSRCTREGGGRGRGAGPGSGGAHASAGAPERAVVGAQSLTWVGRRACGSECVEGGGGFRGFDMNL